MSAWHVTLTGADDSVDPLDLANISARFPFVEWGILWSASREGTPRYPSAGWKKEFAGMANLRSLRASVHLCGPLARGAMAGGIAPPTFLHEVHGSRIQINGFDAAKAGAMVASPHEVILQCRAEEELQWLANFIAARPGQGFSVLFDPSGGRGIETFRWPRAPLGVRMGYAGGIGPSNVLDVLAAIGPVEPTWIDMESGVRTDDRFDLSKVLAVLEQVVEVAK